MRKQLLATTTRRSPVYQILIVMTAILVGGIGIGLGLGLGTSSIVAQDETDEIEACVNRYNGDLRISRTGQCASTETPLTWSQQGIPGEDGEDGDQGPAGPPGMSNYTVVEETYEFPHGLRTSIAVACADGQRAIGGGWNYNTEAVQVVPDISVSGSRPWPDSNQYWQVTISNATSETRDIPIYAVCVDVED